MSARAAYSSSSDDELSSRLRLLPAVDDLEYGDSLPAGLVAGRVGNLKS